MEKGYVHVYTGNGKGKTTASLGLCLRAAGAGFKVYLGQFMKGMETSEIKAIKTLLPNVCVEQFGQGCKCCCDGVFSEEYIAKTKDGYQKALAAMKSGQYDVVILDEINVAAHYNLISVSDVLTLIDQKPEKAELILTGRDAAAEVIERAGLVTEMKEIKHYFNDGVVARVGIEK